MTGPPLWVVDRAESSVFLFGETVGLRATDAWLTEELRGALSGSRELWCEADREELERSPLLASYALSDEPLSARLGSSQLRRVYEVARAVGVNPATLEALRPWAAGQVLESALRTSAGIDATLGVDAVITRFATEAQLPIHSELGDADATFAWFARLGAELEVDYLFWTVERVAKGGREMDRQVDTWKRGDLSVAEEQDEEVRRDHPRLYERMIVERNRAWVPRIAAMLRDPGSVFVLVGGAHLAGDDSIVRLLADEGMEARRVTHRLDD